MGGWWWWYAAKPCDSYCLSLLQLDYRLLAVLVKVMLRDIIGWTEGDSILAPGGSISNMYALIIARHKMFPGHKEGGMRALDSQPVCYTSKHVSSG